MSNLTQNTTALQSVLAAVNALPTKVDTSGTAAAADIYKDKTATVNDVKLTGTNPYNATNVGAALTDSFAALTEKGVTVPSGADVGDLAQLIAAIEAGGEISFTNGRIVPSENTATIEITHNLGVAPDLLICTTYGIGTTYGCVYIAMLLKNKLFQQNSTTDWLYHVKGGDSRSRFTVYSDNIYFQNILTTDTATIDLSGYTSTNFFAGKSYYWYAFAGVTQGDVY